MHFYLLTLTLVNAGRAFFKGFDKKEVEKD